MDDTAIIFLVFTICGVSEIIQGLPLMFEKIKPNWLYGFRLPGIVENKEVWYPVNKYLGKGLVVIGSMLVVITLFLFMVELGLSFFEKTLVLLFTLIIPLVIVMIGSFNYYRELS